VIRALLALGCLSLLGAAGCATLSGPRTPSGPEAAPPAAATPRALAAAREELLRAGASPLTGEVAEAWGAAEEALAAAEAAADHPGAEDAAYVALRMAERARLTALYVADRQALEKARATVRRLGEEKDRRDAFFAGLAHDRRAAAEARIQARAEHRAALEEARSAGGELLELPEGLLFRLPAEALFLPGTSLFRDGADDRLTTLAAALLRPPAGDVYLRVLDDVEGTRTDPARLAARRRARVHDALLAHGVPADAFVPAPPHASSPLPLGTQVDVLLIERPPAGSGP
jgi:outer membrane protein OmpA-like peptidoglycan-associated protein